MTPRARTNQLLYQAQLLLDVAPGDDEHQGARKRASEEGALALFELAIDALLRDVCEHAHLAEHDWRSLLLGDDPPAVAEVHRLRELARDGSSWLYRVIGHVEALHGDEGASRPRSPALSGVIAVDRQADLGQELQHCLEAAKVEIAALRQTSEEW